MLEDIGSPTTAQLKIREIAEDYLKIEENTEYLTHVKRHIGKKQRMRINVDEVSVDIRSLALLSVQFSYLLYTCSVRKMNILISQWFYSLNGNRKQKSVQICVEYMTEGDLMRLERQQAQIIRRQFRWYELKGQNSSLFNTSITSKLFQIIKICKLQQAKIRTPSDKQIFRQFEGLNSILNNYLANRKISNPRITILSLQQTEIFREHSLLLKIMNNSLFSAMRVTGKTKSLIGEVSRIEMKYSSIRNKMKLESRSQVFEKCLQQTIKLLIKLNILSVQQSTNQQSNQLPNQQFTISEIEGNNFEQRKFNCRFYIHQKPLKPFNLQLFDVILQSCNNNQQSSSPPDYQRHIVNKNQILIEYIPFKGTISVKYVTTIELGIENTDFLMYQCNAINSQLEGVSVEFIPKFPVKQVKKERKQRYLGYKCLTNLANSENPIFQIFVMIELVILASKCLEGLFKVGLVRNDDYLRVEESIKKIELMNQLFLRKIEKYYVLVRTSQLKKMQSN